MDSIVKAMDLGAKGLWLPITLAIILLLFVFIMPKKEMSWRGIYVTIGVIGLATWVADNIFAGFFGSS